MVITLRSSVHHSASFCVLTIHPSLIAATDLLFATSCRASFGAWGTRVQVYVANVQYVRTDPNRVPHTCIVGTDSLIQNAVVVVGRGVVGPCVCAACFVAVGMC